MMMLAGRSAIVTGASRGIGPVETDMSGQWSAEYRESAAGRIPIGRLGIADESARIVVFPASDMSDFVTGETINANGRTFMG